MTQLKQLRAKVGPGEFAQVIPTAFQDSLLSSLLEQVTLADQRLISANQDLGSKNSEVVKITAQVEDLRTKVTNRVQGILLGLDAKLESAKQGLKHLEEAINKATQTDIARAEETRPYFEARRKLDELQRFSQVLYMKVASEQVDQSLPKTTAVELVERAVPPIRPISPNRPRAAALMLLGIIFDLAGFRILKGKPELDRIPRPA